MPRDTSTTNLSEILNPIVRPAFFVFIQFASGTVYVWSGRGTYNWNAIDWLGVGSLGSISVIEESTRVDAQGITLGLSGVDPSMLADALQEAQIGLPVAVYLGFFNAAGTALIADPIPAWTGRTDQPTITEDGQSVEISMNCESRMLDMNVGCARRYTHDDAQIENPGDLGFQYVSSIVEMNLYWGRAPSSKNL